MPEMTMTERAWRLDAVAASEVALTKTETETETETETKIGKAAREWPDRAAGARALDHWLVAPELPPALPRMSATLWRRFHQFLRVHAPEPIKRFLTPRLNFEASLREFIAIIETANSPARIESALVRHAQRLVPAYRIELNTTPLLADSNKCESHAEPSVACACECAAGEPNPPCGAAPASAPEPIILELPLRSGSTTRGKLRVRPRAQGVKALRKETIERLTMLCTLGAYAFERMDYTQKWPERSDRLKTSEEGHDPSRDGGHLAGGSFASHARLHDATFLSAILPFALSQARRHNEPLSLICLAIDRLTGIQELLGQATADHLVRSVGETVAALIRASDIVARLDDDRVIAVLPRAPGGGALHVAQKICAGIAERSYEGCEISRVTVSIGVAAFPACADDASSLFDAADEALSQARNLGRNQAILAPRLPSPSPSAHSSSMNFEPVAIVGA